MLAVLTLRESPPLARRAHSPMTTFFLSFGITSACAESTVGNARSTIYSGNHLRLRGEHAPAVNPGWGLVESPPLARRALVPSLCSSQRFGIASACAESTAESQPGCQREWNHLRLRGEHAGRIEPERLETESPPLARRAPKPFISPSSRSGITSACAESTCPQRASAPQRWNHLRLRGEHQAAHRPRRRRDGITSACAESTRQRVRCRARSRNHLRLRGEHI